MYEGMNPRLRAYALLVWDLICSLGAPPYSYDPKGTFSSREIYPRTYSLRTALRLAERWKMPPGAFGGRSRRVTYSHVFINRTLFGVIYVNGRVRRMPEAIKRRLLP